MTTRWAIFGTGGMGREAADIVRRRYPSAAIVFVTDAGGLPVQDIAHITPDLLQDADLLVLAVGNSAARRALRQRFGERRYGTLIAPSAIVSPSASIGEGTILCEGCVVTNNVRIGQHVIINVLSHVSHDCQLGDFVTVSPQTSCNGWITIEDGVFIGAGAVIRNGDPVRRMQIGTDAIVGAGAIVVSDVRGGQLVKGNPAR